MWHLLPVVNPVRRKNKVPMGGATYSPEDLLERLVGFDTTSHKSNLELIRFVEDYLALHGVASTIVYDDTGLKANLFATIGSQNAPGVCLSGHTDVVPVTGQTWTTDPFKLVRKNGRYYGRGTTDMKAFVACALASVPDYLKRDLRVPIHIALSHDEEIGCIGVRSLIARMGKDVVLPAMTIVGEPTGMDVVDAHKGPARWDVELTGRAAHSSMAPLGVNAIMHMSRVMTELLRLEETLKSSLHDARFDPSYSTLQITKISGGTAANIVPVSCALCFDIRTLPGFEIDAFEANFQRFLTEQCLPDMRDVAPEASISLHRSNYVPPFEAQPGSDVVALALNLTDRNETHAVSYATEAGLFQTGGAPSVVCGPGDISQAHTADEWIAVDQVEKCMAFLRRLGDWASTH
ncbi:MAG: acetylornithine deacetylase [Pseudomonadota bacterium]